MWWWLKGIGFILGGPTVGCLIYYATYAKRGKADYNHIGSGAHNFYMFIISALISLPMIGYGIHSLIYG